MASQSLMQEKNYDWYTFVPAIIVRIIIPNPKFMLQQLMLSDDVAMLVMHEKLDDTIEPIRGRFKKRFIHPASASRVSGHEVIMHRITYLVQEGQQMRNVQIKCNRERRLFDTIEGSRLKILIKCSNTKACPNKSNCMRTTEIILGAEKEAFDEFYKPINCPYCGKRLFDVTTDSVCIITIKCEMCGKVATIPVITD